MDTEPLYRRPLNEKQLAILHVLYRFRFATTDLLTKTLGTKDKGKMNRRLKVLVDQEYVGRKFEPEYHLRRQHASFYMLPKGMKALRSLPGAKYASSALHNIYKDRTASERFINHWLGVFDIACKLKARYGDRIRLFTKTELIQFEYFPKPLPDVYMRLDAGDMEKQFFVDLLESSQPLFVHFRRVKQYIEYAEEGDWEDATGAELPAVLLVCDSSSLERKLARYVDNNLDDEDLTLKITGMDRIAKEGVT